MQFLVQYAIFEALKRMKREKEKIVKRWEEEERLHVELRKMRGKEDVSMKRMELSLYRGKGVTTPKPPQPQSRLWRHYPSLQRPNI